MGLDGEFLFVAVAFLAFPLAGAVVELAGVEPLLHRVCLLGVRGTVASRPRRLNYQSRRAFRAWVERVRQKYVKRTKENRVLCQHPGCSEPAKKRIRPSAIEQKYHKFCGPHLYRHTKHQLPRVRQRRKEVNDRLKVVVFTAYARGGPVACSCCGEANLSFLVLDHVNNDGAQHRKAVIARNGKRSGAGGHIMYRWLRDRGFPNDPPLQILCANCNMGKQGNGGVCPHVTSRSSPTGLGSVASSVV